MKTLYMVRRTKTPAQPAIAAATRPERAARDVTAYQAGWPAIRHSVRRIHIIGGPGTGKTTLSLQLANHLDVPVFELDEIAQAGPEPHFRFGRPLGQRLAVVHEIATSAEWITEGSFLWWADALLDAATVIVWLDLPPYLAIGRVLARQRMGRLMANYIVDVLGQPNWRARVSALRHPHIRPIVVFLHYTWKYYRAPLRQAPPSVDELDDGWALSRAETAQRLAQYEHKVIRCTRPAEIAALVERFTVALPQE